MTTFGTPPDDPQEPAAAAPADPQPTPPTGAAGTVSPGGYWTWSGSQWVPNPAAPAPAPPPGYGPPPSGYGYPPAAYPAGAAPGPMPGDYPPSGYPPPAYPGSGYPMAMAGPAPGLAYAGFWVRFLAWFIDGAILFIPVLVVSGLAGGFVRTDEFGNPTINGNAYLLAILVEVGYFLICWGTMSRTPGMMALKLRIVRVEDGAPIEYGRAAVRLVGFIASYAVFCIGLIWAGFDPRKQGWHDKIASTFVVRQY